MNWQRWIRPGLALTVLVALMALFSRLGLIEQDLGARVATQLTADGQEWAQVTVSARDVTLGGIAPSTDAQEVAERSARKVAGVRGVTDGSDLLPLASPYVWSARRDGKVVTLTGSVPSDGARAQVMAAARRALPEGEIRDNMALARGAPVSFGGATTFGLARLADLGQGVVTLTDAELAVSGVAATPDSFKTSMSELTTGAPAGVTISAVDVQPARADPFVWSANFDGSAVTVVGFVPNDIVGQALSKTLAQALPGVTVHENLTIASGEPPGFAEAASFAIGTIKHLSQGGVTLDGLRLDVTGAAKSVQDYDTLLAILSGALPTGMTVVSMAISPAPVDTYGWQGTKQGGAIVLSGYVPSEASRAELTAAAKELFPGMEINDQVRVASGEPRMDWIGAIKFAMTQLALLERGRVVVGDQEYSIDGVALSPEAYTAIHDVNAKTLPASLALGSASVAAPALSPYRFRAERQGGGLLLSGAVPDDEARDTILAAAKRAFGPAKIDDQLVYASGAPAGFSDVAKSLVEISGRLVGGHVELVDGSVTLDGLVYQPGALEEIRDKLAATLPESFVVAANTLATGQPGQPVVADACRDLIQGVLKTGQIAFDGEKADIAAASTGVLDRVSAAVRRCTGVIVEVGAHSDSQGSASRNRDRTQARAEAIVDYLVDAGVRRENLVAVGYGESKPLGDNRTEDGRAQNQRIEFTVTAPGG